jgi:formate hydrogenlyase subunit 3/multisubunit Na+/H+ antiporter MnhD subunit
MKFLFIAAILLFASGAVLSSKTRLSYLFSFLGSVSAFLTGCFALTQTQVLWNFPLLQHVELSLYIDHLSAIFIIIAAISWMALALYSIDYSKLYPKKRLPLGFNLSLLGMLLILTAHDGITLLMGWEIMTIFAFLMMQGTGKSFVHSYRFLAFGELSTISLLIGFSALYSTAGSLSFDALHNGSFFVLILLSLGFIIKMDIVPFHGWMRGIYGEIPDNTAALLSAPVTLMGVYGLERIIPLLPNNQLWDIIIILLGAFSAFWGGLQAAAVDKIRLLPAYSTVENNGMILTAIGFYALAEGSGIQSLHYLATFAMAASIILVISHTFSKTLLFMSIGHAKEAYNVHTIDQARGVWSGVGRIPAIGIVISALSFSAFPPLIGYAGEWMILETLFQSYRFPSVAIAFSSALAGILIALAIGLISFAMIKLIGYTALGYDHGRKSRPIPNRLMHIAEVSLESLIVLGGIGLPLIIMVIGFPQLLTGLLAIPAPLVLASNMPVFGVISPTFIGIIMLVLLIIPILLFMKNKKKTRKVESWNGGIKLEESEFFTAPAYSQILEHILHGFYHTRERKSKTRSSISVEDMLIWPSEVITRMVRKTGERLSLILMNGKISAYVAYILILFITVFIIGMIAM